MFNLMRGSYENVTNINHLKKYPVPTQAEIDERGLSSRFQPIAHYDLVDALRSALAKLFDIKPMNPRFGISPNGLAMVGGFDLADAEGNPWVPANYANEFDTKDPRHNMAFSVGLAHANDGQHAARCAAGGTVSVCENGMCSGEDTWKHKHTGSLSGPGLLEWVMDGLRQLWEKITNTPARIKRMLSPRNKITPEQHDAMMMHIGRERILPWRLVGEADTMWRKSLGLIYTTPTDDDPASPQHATIYTFTEGTAWDWYNMLNVCVKGIPIPKQAPTLQKLFELAESLCITKPPKLIIDADPA